MSNKNVITNLTIKQMAESSAMGFNKDYIARSSDVNFDILGKAFRDTGKAYAKLKIAIETNNCISDYCEYEMNKVKQILNDKLAVLPNVEFIIYEPQARFEARDNIKKAKQSLTPIRAMLLDSFEYYNRIEDSLNLLVAQKLAYFLQRLGEPLRLEYSKGWYGPYARNLDKVLQAMNGSYLVYQAQFNKPSTTINLVPDKRMEIENNLAILDAEQKQRLKTLKEFIYGFETAFSLELLATVDWIKNQRPELSYEEVHTEISQWTKRKADLIKLHHVKVAYNHLEKNKHLLKA